MLEIGETAREGFRRLSGLIEDTADKESKLTEMARKAFLAHLDFMEGGAKGPVHFHGMSAIHFGGSWHHHQARQIEMHYPEAYLLHRAWKTGDRSFIDQTLLPRLTDSKDPGLKKSGKELESQLELYFCPAEAFLEVARDYIKEHRDPRTALNAQGLHRITTIWAERKLDGVETEALVFEELEKASKMANSGYPGTQFLSPLFERRLEKDGRPGVRSFLMKLGTVFLGPEQDWPKILKANTTRNSNLINQSRLNPMGFNQFTQFLKQESQSDRVFPIAEFVEDCLVPHVDPNHYAIQMDGLNNLELGNQTVFKESPDKIFEILERSLMLDELETVRLYITPQRSESSLFGMTVQNISRLEDDEKEVFLEWLGEKDTFGRQLMLASLEKESATAVANHLTKHRAGLEKLPPARQINFMTYAAKAIPEAADLTELPEDSRKTVAWLRGLKNSDLSDEIEEVMAAKSLSDLPYETYRVDEKAQQLVTEVAKVDPDKARELFWKFSGLVEKAQRTGTWNRSYGSRSTFGGNLVYRMLSNSSTASLDSLDFLFSLAMDPDKKRQGKIGWPDQRRVQSLLQKTLREFNKKEKIEERLIAFAQKITDKISPQHHGLLTGHLGYALKNGDSLDSGKIESYQKALTGIRNDKNQVVIDELKMALGLYRGTQSSGKEKPDLSAEKAFLLGKISNEQAPLAQRFYLSETILTNYPTKTTGPEFFNKSFAILDEAASAKLITDPNRLTGYSNGLRSDLKPGKTISEDLRKNGKIFLEVCRKVSANQKNQSQSYNVLTSQLSLALAIDDVQSANRIILKGQRYIDTGWLTSMLEWGKPDLAARLLNKYWQNLDCEVSRGTSPYYSTDLGNKIPELIGGIENPDLALFGRVLLTSLRDPSQKEEGFVERPDRLKKLVEGVKSHAFTNAQMGEGVLAMMVVEPEIATELQDRILDVASSLSVMPKNNSAAPYHGQRTARLLKIYLRQSLQKGPEALRKRFEELARLRFNQSYNANQAIGSLIDAWTEGFFKDSSTWSSETLKKNLTLWEDFLTAANARNLGSTYVGWTSRALLVHALANEPEKIKALWEKIPAPAMKYLDQDRYSFMQDLRSQIDNAVREEQFDDATRRRAFEILYVDPMFIKKCNQQLTSGNNRSASSYATEFFARMAKSKFVSHKDLFEMAPALIKENPRQGVAGKELATMHENEEQFEEALKYWNLAVENVHEDNDDHFTDFHLSRARCLAKLDRYEDALKGLEGMDQERIPKAKAEERNARINDYSFGAKAKAGAEADVLTMANDLAAKEEDAKKRKRNLAGAYRILGERLHARDPLHPRSATFLTLANALYSELDNGRKSKSVSSETAATGKTLVEVLQAQKILPTPSELVGYKGEWQYHDQGRDQGTAWIEPDFDASSWSTGQAPLGYDDNNDTTD
ncbi:MAG: hypothetical protein AAF514_08360 [Verrucomicrobiota bacterium]